MSRIKCCLWSENSTDMYYGKIATMDRICNLLKHLTLSSVAICTLIVSLNLEHSCNSCHEPVFVSSYSPMYLWLLKVTLVGLML